MNIDEVVFTSVCFGDPRYFAQLDNLAASILKIYPAANMMFFRGFYPEGARDMYHSLYGFKAHAVKAAKQKFKKVVWLDPAMMLVDKIDDLAQFDMMAVKDDNKLFNVVSDRCYDHYGLTREMVEGAGWHLVGGSVYWFDFTKRCARSIFESWYEAEVSGMFGSQEEQARGELQGHRMDEAVMALAMYLNGVEPVDMQVARYCNEGSNPMFIKRHFK